MGVSRLLVTGVVTSVCVESTVRSGDQRGRFGDSAEEPGGSLVDTGERMALLEQFHARVSQRRQYVGARGAVAYGRLQQLHGIGGAVEEEIFFAGEVVEDGDA